jgi:hypothetical protein
MRFVVPTRVPYSYAVIFAVVLVLVQLVEHTFYLYSALTGLFVLVFAAAFNAAGGLVYPSGYWVFFNGTLAVLFGIVFKAILGEPGHTNLQDPIGTLSVDCVAMVAFGAVAALNRKIAPKKPFVSLELEGEAMKKAAIGCFIFGAILTVTCWPTLNDQGTLASALRQVNHFNEMGVLLATFYEVRKTGGRRSTNWIVWASGSVVFLASVMLFAKQGMIGAPFTWFLAGILAGHNFTKKQLLFVAVGFVLFQQYLVPYSQVARNYRSDDYNVAADSATALQFLKTLPETRATFRQDEQESIESNSENHLYDQPEGFFDRLCMLKPDDDLISFTNRGNVEGMYPTVLDLINVIPHFLWKNKPVGKIGNMYSHEMGGLADDDDTTGISYSPQADAYHQATWFGVLVLLPAFLIPLFYLIDAIGGDVRSAPWGVLYIITIATTAPEATMAGITYTATFLTETILAVAIVAKYILPIFAGVITNSERTRVRKTRDFQPIPVGRGPQPLASAGPSPEIE